jgi:hypothetical protein
MRNIPEKVIEKIKTIILSSVTFFFLKSCRLRDNVKKLCRAGQATDDNMAHAQNMLVTKGYIYTLRLCNTHCSSAATMVARMRLIVTL